MSCFDFLRAQLNSVYDTLYAEVNKYQESEQTRKMLREVKDVLNQRDQKRCCEQLGNIATWYKDSPLVLNLIDCVLNEMIVNEML